MFIRRDHSSYRLNHIPHPRVLNFDNSIQNTSPGTYEVYYTNNPSETLHGISQDTNVVFDGICMDIGAQKSVAGIIQTKAYLQAFNKKWVNDGSRCLFKFGSCVYESIGKIPIRIPTPNGGVIEVFVDVIKEDVPIIFGLNTLDKEQLYVDNIDNTLVHKHQNWKMPLVRKKGHIYLTWKYSEILYTKHELRRFHLHFYHPTARKLFNLITRSSPTAATSATFELIEEITKACKTCQRFTPRPQSFQVTMPDGIIFNHELAIDLMFINKTAILHVVDTHTRFNAAEILTRQTVEGVWRTFLTCWAAVYVGYPNKLRVDAGSVFTSARWKEISNMNGIQIQLSGVESHNSIGAGETYHAPLRRIFLKIQIEYPMLTKSLTLKLAVKALNDTAGPNGLVPSLLVFGILPRFPATHTELPNQRDRMNALNTARREMETIVAEQRLKTALTTKIPPASTIQFNVGQKVLVYREKPQIKWTGPHIITKIDGKAIYIDRNGTEVQHSVHQVKPFIEDEVEEIFHIMHNAFSILTTDDKDNTMDTLLTRTLSINDPEGTSAQFMDAKKREIDGLERRKVWKMVEKDTVPHGANILNGRFVLTVKHEGTNDEKHKARFVVQGHKDSDKFSLVHTTTTSKQASTRILVSLAIINGFDVWSCDVSQAYVQSSMDLQRDVYVRPPKEFYDNSSVLLKLLKPLYGLSDAGDYWDSTIKLHVKNDLGMEQTVSDMSLSFKQRSDKMLMGMRASYVDDGLLSGDEEFKRLSEATLKKFESRPPEPLPTKFSGITIERKVNKLVLQQLEYMSTISQLPQDCSFPKYRSVRQQLVWIMHTVPQICFGVNQAAQVTESSFTVDDIKYINKIILFVTGNFNLTLKYPPLDKSSLRLKVYSDSSFANNRDLTSQLGYIILLCDGNNRCHVLAYSSHKCKRTTRSVLGSEAYAFADAFDRAYVIRRDLEKMLNKNIPMTMFTDSKSLFDVIVKCGQTSEKRLMIDLQAVRDAYSMQEISDVGFIRSQFNPSDAFTKLTTSAVLDNIVNNCYINHPIEQFVIRSKPLSLT